ncbi:uncharacterized protein [Aegilops tauschii subsp. strangulata]|uniref:uncharacterized protein n=1 Tax=Aegilops tauschii subsp. strangulata TaxID=200361 RepID=UPI00098A16EE|nr:ethylene-responsive transcription factor ERF073-like [Aegilops tauschii subsp. strangulata]
MPPRRRGGSGFRGVRVRPFGTYSASIRLGGGVRLGLGTFDTAQDGARAYNAAAWRLRRSRWGMNFTDVATPERAQELAPFSRLITDEDRHKNGRRVRRLSLAEMDKEAMALWRQRFPQDIINEEQFFAERRAGRKERAAYREDKQTRKAVAKYNMALGDASSRDSRDDRFLDAYAQTSEEDITETESESENDE